MTIRDGTFPTSHHRSSAVLARQAARDDDIKDDENRRAVRRVAMESVSAAECAEILAMLGLTAEMGKTEVEGRR
jgi:hypothetical protein